MYKDLLQCEESILVLTPAAVVRSIKDNQVFRTAFVQQCLQVGNLVVCTDALIGRNLRVKNNLSVGGNEAIQGNLTVEGNLVVNGGQVIVGPITLQGDLTVNGNEIVNGNITAVDITATGNFLASDNSYTFTSDLGSGMHHPALGTLTFATGGVTRLQIEPTGTVRIPDSTGTSNALVVQGNINAPAATIIGGATSCANGQTALELTSGSDINPTLRVTQTCGADAVDVTGNVSIDGDVTITGTISTSSLQFLAGDGTASTPSYSFTSDTNTGIYRPEPDTVAISTGSVERLFINGAGTMTINSATGTNTSLIVNGDGSVSTAVITNSGTGTALEVIHPTTGNALVATGIVNINTTGSADTNIGNTSGGGAVNIDAGAASHFITSAATLTFNAASSIDINNSGIGSTTIGSATSRINLPGLPTDGLLPGMALVIDGSNNVQKLAFTNAPTDNTIAWRDNSGNLQVHLPIADVDAANKAYVDAVATGLVVKAPVRALAATPIVLSGSQTIDGVLVVAGDRVLAVGQIDNVDNGIWVVQAGAWDRPTDYACGQSAAGSYTLVEEGTTYAGTDWVASTPAPADIICTNPIAWVEFTAPQAVTGNNVGTGSGLVFRDKTGTVLNFRTLNQANHILIDTDTSVINTVTIQTDATSANTANTIVSRDASGDFAAGAISALTLTATGNITSTTGNISATAGDVSGNNIIASGNITATGNISGDNISSSGQFLAATGSATAPSYSFSADPNTGIYRPAANQIAVSTNGVERMLVNGVGTVTIDASAGTADALVVIGNSSATAETITAGLNRTALAVAGNGTAVAQTITTAGSGTTLEVSNTGTGSALTVTGSAGATAQTITAGTNQTALAITGNGTAAAQTITKTGSGATLTVASTGATGGNALIVTGSDGATAQTVTAGTNQTALAITGNGSAIAETVTTAGSGTTLEVSNTGSGVALVVDGSNGATAQTVTAGTNQIALAITGNGTAAAETVTTAGSGTSLVVTNTGTGNAVTVTGSNGATAQAVTAGLNRTALAVTGNGNATAETVTTAGSGSSLAITNTGTGVGLTVTASGNTAQTISAGTNQVALAITGNGTANAQTITKTGSGTSLDVSNTGTGIALAVTGSTGNTAQTITAGTNRTALAITGNGSATAQTITKGGAGDSLAISNTGTGVGLTVTASGNTAQTITAGTNQTALAITGNGTAPAETVTTAGSAATLELRNTGTGIALSVIGSNSINAGTITAGTGQTALLLTSNTAANPTLRLTQGAATSPALITTGTGTFGGNLTLQPLTLTMNAIGTLDETGVTTTNQCVIPGTATTGSGASPTPGQITIDYSAALSSILAAVATNVDGGTDAHMNADVVGTSVTYSSRSSAGALVASKGFRYIVIGVPL